MKNVSRDFQLKMLERTDFYCTADITFANGETKELSRKDFSVSGNSISIGAGSQSFPLGLLIPKQITLSLVNDDERWADYRFYDAQLRLVTNFIVDEEKNTVERINEGLFTVITPETYGTVVEIVAMDDSYKTDIPYDTSLAYPMSVSAALRDVCTRCGITLLTSNFVNSNYEIRQKPEGITCRNFIGFCAMIAGGNAVFDEYNRLSIVPYDFTVFEKDTNEWGGVFDDLDESIYQTGDDVSGGVFNPWDVGEVTNPTFSDLENVHVFHDFKSGIKIEQDDVVITGALVTDGEGIDHLYGNEGYVLQLENPFAAEKEDDFVELIGKIIVGLRFRPFSGEHIAYPISDFGDLAIIPGINQRVYRTVLTDVIFNYYGLTTFKCAADSPTRNSSDYGSETTKAIVQARKNTEKQISEYDKAVQSLTSLITQSFGVYKTEEIQSDGSVVYYMHNRPKLEQSMTIWKMTADAFAVSRNGGQTWTAGIDSSGNAVLNVLNVIGINADWIRTGELSANLIKGGLLKIGGINNTNASIQLLDSSGVQFGVINNGGIEFNSKGTVKAEIIRSIDPDTEKEVRIKEGQISFHENYRAITNNGFIQSRDSKLYIGAITGIDFAINNIYLIHLNKDKAIFSVEINVSKIIAENITTQEISVYGSQKSYIESEIHFKNVTYFDNDNSQGSIVAAGDVSCKSLGVSSYSAVYGNMDVYGNFSVKGTKKRDVNTRNYGRKSLYCYEMSFPMFGDIGQGITNESGECIIDIDDIFSETIASGMEYQVFLQKEGPGDIWVEEKSPLYFIVKGTPNLKFAWEIKAIQRDYETDRLEDIEQIDDDFYLEYQIEEMEKQYLEDTEKIISEQEEIYETA